MGAVNRARERLRIVESYLNEWIPDCSSQTLADQWTISSHYRRCEVILHLDGLCVYKALYDSRQEGWISR
jgi:hypothetical protein